MVDLQQITDRLQQTQIVDCGVPPYLIAYSRRIPYGLLSSDEEHHFTATGVLTNTILDKSWVPLVDEKGECTELFHATMEEHLKAICMIREEQAEQRQGSIVQTTGVFRLVGNKCVRSVSHDVTVCLACRTPMCLECQLRDAMWCNEYYGYFHVRCHDH
jgi:hypothetical protein